MKQDVTHNILLSKLIFSMFAIHHIEMLWLLFFLTDLCGSMLLQVEDNSPGVVAGKFTTSWWSSLHHCRTRSFRGKKGEHNWLLRGVEPGLPRGELKVTTTMLPVNVVFQMLQFVWCYYHSPVLTLDISISSSCRRHFSLPNHAPLFSRIYPLGGQFMDVWKIGSYPRKWTGEMLPSHSRI